MSPTPTPYFCGSSGHTLLPQLEEDERFEPWPEGPRMRLTSWGIFFDWYRNPGSAATMDTRLSPRLEVGPCHSNGRSLTQPGVAMVPNSVRFAVDL